MSTLSRTELERSLRDGRLQPLYLLLGSETYLRSVAAQAISDAALSETLLREFNETGFSLLSDSVQAAIAAAEQLPMMSERRVVKIKNFAKLREADEDVLVRYLGNPIPSTVMIFSANELDKRKKTTIAVLETCTVDDFTPLKDAEAKAWVRTRSNELQV